MKQIETILKKFNQIIAFGHLHEDYCTEILLKKLYHGTVLVGKTQITIMIWIITRVILLLLCTGPKQLSL